jgi:hypothetical protein
MRFIFYILIFSSSDQDEETIRLKNIVIRWEQKVKILLVDVIISNNLFRADSKNFKAFIYA